MQILPAHYFLQCAGGSRIVDGMTETTNIDLARRLLAAPGVRGWKKSMLALGTARINPPRNRRARKAQRRGNARALAHYMEDSRGRESSRYTATLVAALEAA